MFFWKYEEKNLPTNSLIRTKASPAFCRIRRLASEPLAKSSLSALFCIRVGVSTKSVTEASLFQVLVKNGAVSTSLSTGVHVDCTEFRTWPYRVPGTTCNSHEPVSCTQGWLDVFWITLKTLYFARVLKLYTLWERWGTFLECRVPRYQQYPHTTSNLFLSFFIGRGAWTAWTKTCRTSAHDNANTYSRRQTPAQNS